MIKKILCLLAFSIVLCSCNSMMLVSGTGASKSKVVKKKQWFALWGLVRLNKVDAKSLAGNVPNYTVKTEFTFGDMLSNIFTSIVSIEKESVTVIK